MATLRLKVITTNEEIEKKILRSMAKHLNSKLQGRTFKGEVQFAAYNLMFQALTASRETQSIISGQLRSELGVVDASSQLSEIIKQIVHASEIKVTQAKVKAKGISMTVRFSAVPVNLDSFASIGKYRTEKGVEIPWFEWLTSIGDRVIVRD